MSKRKVFKYLLIPLIAVVLGIAIVGVVATIYVLGRKNNNTYPSGMNVAVSSFDNVTLYGKVVMQSNESHKWAILIHSYGADHSMMNSYAQKYQDWGYHTLCPDNRAHGMSKGYFIGMGYLDYKDVLVWVDYILKLDKDAEIVMHGISMGAVSLMILSGSETLPNDNIKAIIEDCGYKSAESYLKWKLEHNMNIPSFPVWQITNIFSRILAGYWLKSASAINTVQLSKVPILFIHGTEDETVPVEDAYSLYKEAKCRKKLLIVDGAGHGQSEGVAGDDYWDNVRDWINEK